VGPPGPAGGPGGPARRASPPRVGAGARGQRREAARRLLESFEPAALERWAATDAQAWPILQSLLFDPEPLVRWRAAETAGRVAGERARRDPEGARDMIRRTLWLMNDESGGVLWLGPQVVGSVLAHVPGLQGEFLPVLASFLEEEPFRAGARWGLWRVALASPAAVSAATAELAPSLRDPDPEVRGLAALALVAAAGPGSASAARGDGVGFELFDPRTGALRRVTVGEAAGG
jgi:HEAT repeat protein